LNDASNCIDVTIDIFEKAFLFIKIIYFSINKFGCFFQNILHAMFQDASLIPSV